MITIIYNNEQKHGPKHIKLGKNRNYQKWRKLENYLFKQK